MRASHRTAGRHEPGEQALDYRLADELVRERLVDDGAQAVVLGCTEIELLLRPQDVDVPLLATTRLHVEAAVERALAGGAAG